MKTFLFKPLSWTALCLSMLLLAACSSNDPLGELANSELQQRPEPQALTRFSSGIKPSNGPRKTLMDRGGNFYWTPGDKIWVKDGARYTQDAQNSIMAVQESADFYLPGTMTATEYTVFYTGQSSPEASSTSTTSLHVKISGTQEQTIPNNAEHFANSGDCGTARATHEGDGSYNFQLTHKASYLIFAPKSPNVEKAGKCILKKITVESTGSSNLCGTYDFTTGHLTDGTSTGNTITLEVGDEFDGVKGQDFPIPATQDVRTNGAFMVIRPGTHALTITYTVEYYGIEQDITKTVSSREFLENKYYTIGHTLNVEVPEFVFYFPDTYYMWDAQKWYWYGQSVYPTILCDAYSTFPRNQQEDPLRWFNDIDCPDGNSNPIAYTATNSAKDMPNVNDLTWYVMYGDPHYDTSTEWSLGGVKQRGGYWLKKKKVIISEIKSSQPNVFVSNRSTDGSDWRSKHDRYLDSRTAPGRPSNTADYFFLPAMARYINGKFHTYGNSNTIFPAYYWSSSSNPTYYYQEESTTYKTDPDEAYYLEFDGIFITVSVTGRTNGFVAGSRPDGSSWFQ